MTMAFAPHELNRTLSTLREAAALPLRACLDPYGTGLEMAACRTVAFAWLAVIYPCRRPRLTAPELLIAARLEQCQRLLPPKTWRRFERKFQREVLS